MDNWIYVLLGIGWVVYSFYTANQKTKKKNASSGMPPFPNSGLPPVLGREKPTSVFEKILRELEGVPEPHTSPIPYTNMDTERVKEDVAPNKIGKKKLSDLSLEEIFDESDPNISHRTNTKEESLPNIPKESAQENKISTNFNLRDAVIFSELLNRKYF